MSMLVEWYHCLSWIFGLIGRLLTYFSILCGCSIQLGLSHSCILGKAGRDVEFKLQRKGWRRQSCDECNVSPFCVLFRILFSYSYLQMSEFFKVRFCLFFVSFVSCILIPFIFLYLRIHPLPLPLPPTIKQKSNFFKKISLWMLQCNTVSHALNPFIHIFFFPARVHCIELLIWFEVSGFNCTISNQVIRPILKEKCFRNNPMDPTNTYLSNICNLKLDEYSGIMHVYIA